MSERDATDARKSRDRTVLNLVHEHVRHALTEAANAVDDAAGLLRRDKAEPTWVDIEKGMDRAIEIIYAYRDEHYPEVEG